MKATTRQQRATDVDLGNLRRMVGPDRHRPGVERGRLIAESVPVWAIIGHIGAVGDTTDPGAITDEVIAQVAFDYDIPLEAVEAAILYYQEHRGAIDALLAANAAAFA